MMADLPNPNTMLHGPSVVRIVWLPGTDLLDAHCPCGRSATHRTPIEAWHWLDAARPGHDATEHTVPGTPTGDPVHETDITLAGRMP